MTLKKFNLSALLASMFFLNVAPVVADETKTLNLSTECGKIIEAEFQKTNEAHTFTVAMEPGDRFNILIDPVGDYLLVGVKIFEPSGKEIDNKQVKAGKSLNFKSGVLSGRGNYQLLVRNFPYNRSGHMQVGTAGLYELHIGCTKRNGQEIVAKKR